MNGRLWFCVLCGVAVAHVAVLVIIANVRNLQHPPAKPAEPTFMTSTITVVDEQGRKLRERSEYTVSTRLADDATLKKLPPPPAATPR
jgi:hypothetical protein